MNSVKNKYHISRDTAHQVDVMVTSMLVILLFVTGIPLIAFNLWRSIFSQMF